MQQKQCSGCQNLNSCERIYQRLGHSHAAPVLAPVLVAFVLPLVTFVLALAASQKVCAGLSSENLSLLLSFLMALGATVASAAAGAWWLRLTCNEQQEVRENG